MEQKCVKNVVRVCPNQIFLRTRQPKMGWQTIVRSVTKKEDANLVEA